MIRVLIVDDENPARKELRAILEKNTNISIVGECYNGNDTIIFLLNHEVDLIFLDIEMPSMNGLETAKKIKEMLNAPKIIFSTGFEQFAIQAFELEAFDYILKPYTPERIFTTIQRFIKAQQSQSHTNTDKMLPIKISVWYNNKLLVFDASEITLIKADQNKRNLIFTQSGVYETNIPLKKFEEDLRTSGFLRTHKSYIVNMDKVREITPWFNDTYILTLENCSEKEIPVSRHYIQAFKNFINF